MTSGTKVGGNPAPPAPNIIKPGFRFHLSSLVYCAVAMGFLMWVATSFSEYAVADAVRRFDTSKMTPERAAEALATIKTMARIPVFFNCLTFAPFVLGCVVAFNELRIRGRDAKYADGPK